MLSFFFFKLISCSFHPGSVCLFFFYSFHLIFLSSFSSGGKKIIPASLCGGCFASFPALGRLLLFILLSCLSLTPKHNKVAKKIRNNGHHLLAFLCLLGRCSSDADKLPDKWSDASCLHCGNRTSLRVPCHIKINMLHLYLRVMH